MNATVIVNRYAGSAAAVDADALASVLCDVGFEAVARPTADLDELDDALDSTEGLVVSVGGDGTLRAIALRMIGRDRPLSLIPLGTANNVAAGLGLADAGSPEDQLRRLASPRQRAFDLGRVRTRRGEEYFLEACGLGLYADLLADYRPEAGKNVLRALDAIEEVIVGFEPWPLRVEVDGEVLEGPFVLAAAMNTERMGLRVPLAPRADPSDGRLDVVLVRHQEGRGLFGYATRLARGRLEEEDDVVRLRTERLRIVGEGNPFHVDDVVIEPESGDEPVVLDIDVLPGALRLWLPGEAE